jgi:hypothetical protein
MELKPQMAEMGNFEFWILDWGLGIGDSGF